MLIDSNIKDREAKEKDIEEDEEDEYWVENRERELLHR
jgi:hypothetical protein